MTAVTTVRPPVGVARVPVALCGTGLVTPWAESAGALAAASADAAHPGQGWFDTARHLGPTGWRFRRPASRMAEAAARLALAGGADGPGAGPPERRATVLGTNHAITALHAELHATMLDDGARGLGPATVPSFAVNTAASELAIALDRRGPCLTLTSPAVAGVEAVLTGCDLLRRGGASDVLAGAVEEPVPGERSGTGGACVTALRALPAGDTAPGAPRVLGGFCRVVPAECSAGTVRVLGPALREVGRGLPYRVVAGAGHGWLHRLARRVLGGPAEAVAGGPEQLATVAPLTTLAALVARHGAGVVVCGGPFGTVAALAVGPAS